MNTSDLEEKMVEVDEQTAKEAAFDLKKFYKKHPELYFASLSGSSKRKLIRANTIHLRAICPACGSGGMKYNPSTKKWSCKKCGSSASRKEIDYVKYA